MVWHAGLRVGHAGVVVLPAPFGFHGSVGEDELQGERDNNY